MLKEDWTGTLPSSRHYTLTKRTQLMCQILYKFTSQNDIQNSSGFHGEGFNCSHLEYEQRDTIFRAEIEGSIFLQKLVPNAN
jgi:hypothetical protein